MKTIFFHLLYLTSIITAYTQSEAEILITEAIHFHDPHSQWQKLKAEIDITSIVEGEGRRDTSFRVLRFDLEKGLFEMRQDTTVCKVPCEDCERAKMYNNYFRYLLGMPMKLRDPGPIISEVVNTKNYRSQ